MRFCGNVNPYCFLISPVQICLKLIFFLSTFRSLAEFSRIPVVVTNQVRSQGRDEASRYSFQGIISKVCYRNSLLTTIILGPVQFRTELNFQKICRALIHILLLLWGFSGLMLFRFVLCSNLDRVLLNFTSDVTSLKFMLQDLMPSCAL